MLLKPWYSSHLRVPGELDTNNGQIMAVSRKQRPGRRQET
jgi:hypothetical protein